MTMESLYAQFHRPMGFWGRVAGWIMALRSSNRARNEWTVALLNLSPADRVLEIGFGPGLALREVVRHLQEGEVVGLDHSPVMLRQAGRRNRAAVEAGKLRLLLGDVEDLGAAEGRFDKVFAVNVVQFWENQEESLRKVIARLNPGGLLAITHMPRQPRAKPADADKEAALLRELFEKLDLKSVTVHRLDLKPMPAICVTGVR